MTSLEQQSLLSLDWPKILDALSQEARSLQGRALAQELVLLNDLEAIQDNFTIIEELWDLSNVGEHIPTGGSADIRQALDTAKKGRVLELEDISDCAACLVSLAKLQGWISGRAQQCSRLALRAEALYVDEALKKILVDSFEEPGVLSERCYPKLKRLREEIIDRKAQIQRTLNQLIQEPRIKDVLQDQFVTTRGDRAVLPIRASAKRTGIGIVHDSSASGETVFIEPNEVVELQNKKKVAELALIQEEHKIRQELSNRLGESEAEIAVSLEIAWELDLLAARLSLGQKLNGCIPNVGLEGIIDLQQARHPLLVLAGGTVVPNALKLDKSHPGLILTGPNAGGKTVALKTLALAALFVRACIPFPAKSGCRIDLFDRVLADIGDAQAIAEGLSTFSAHIKTLKMSLDLARRGTLVLLDELAVGTDPSQGAALAEVVLQHLINAHARVVTTTHYSELKTLPARDSRFQSAAVSFSKGRPTYNLKMGETGLSHAFSIARTMGLPEDLIQEAKSTMSTHEQEWVEQSERLAEEIAAHREETAAIRSALAETNTEKQRLREAREKLRQQKDHILNEEKAASRQRQKEAEAQIKRLIAELQAKPSLQSAGAALKDLRSKNKTPSRDEKKPVKPAVDVQVGDDVFIESLGRRGIVRSLARGGRVEVQIGNMNSLVPLTDLRDVSKKKKRPHTPRHSPHPLSDSPQLRTTSNTLDLRGERVDEALQKVDFFLDRMLQNGGTTAYILHGHGTGALKKAVRQWLHESPLIESYRPATDSEGGDAFTHVSLR